MGIMKMKVKEKDFEYISFLKFVEMKLFVMVKGKDYYVNLELDLRGECYENVLIWVEKYIDDVLLVNYLCVLIIYGKGIGVFCKGV